MTWIVRTCWLTADGTSKRFTRRCATKPSRQPFTNPVTGETAVFIAETDEHGTEQWARYFVRVDWYEMEEIKDE